MNGSTSRASDFESEGRGFDALRALAAAAVVAALCGLALPATAEAQPLRRLAVVIGNDEGGDSTRPLLYARDDARKIHGILLRLGGVRPEDAALVLNGDAADVLAALGQMERRAQEAARAGERTALFLYYSGHAKDGALRLGDSQLPFAALRQRLAQAPAEIKIGIFDSCRSGMITRTKGARRAPAFEIQADPGRDARGLVILTSSASDEDSQESDQIQGSYFSHHLASGLLGDADRSGDGRVSLSEAYAYAYDRTVADTAESSAGAQHPTFSYELAGNGDLVLTDVGARTEGLLFPARAPGGVYYLVDRKGSVVAEVWKEPEAERRIAMPPGLYRLKRRLADRLRVGEVEVVGGQVARVEESLFRDAPFSDDPVKGASRELATRVGFALAGQYQAFFDADTRDHLFPPASLIGVELELRHFFRRDWVWGFEVAAGNGRGGAVEVFGVSYGFTMSELALSSSLTAEWHLGGFVPFVGARLALLLLSRDFAQAELPHQTLATWSPGVVGGLRYHLSDHWALVVRGRTHAVFYNLDQPRPLGYWELGALVTYDL